MVCGQRLCRPRLLGEIQTGGVEKMLGHIFARVRLKADAREVAVRRAAAMATDSAQVAVGSMKSQRRLFRNADAQEQARALWREVLDHCHFVVRPASPALVPGHPNQVGAKEAFDRATVVGMSAARPDARFFHARLLSTSCGPLCSAK